MSANRVQAAERLIAEAEKHMKTSFIALKFSPDVDSAIEAYDKGDILYFFVSYSLCSGYSIEERVRIQTGN